jgi:hypothetical protein
MKLSIAVLAAAALLSPLAVSAQRPAVRRIFVQVVDPSAKPILDLAASDFALTENDVPRKVTRATLVNQPLRIVLLVDSSANMAPWLMQWREGLRAFIEHLPGPHEVALISTGRQLRVRVPPTADRARLLAAADSFTSDEGANAFLDSLMEADKRFLRTDPPRWPVFLILTTDNGATLRELHIEEFNPFVRQFIARAGSAHAVLVQGKNTGITTELVMNLTGNAGGVQDTMVMGNGVPARMHAAALRIHDEYQQMLTRYELEYAGEATTGEVSVDVWRPDTRVLVSFRRPF